MKRVFFKMTVFILLTHILLGGDLIGTVIYRGKIPAAKRLRMDSDPACCANDQEDNYSESFLVDENNHLANVIIYLNNVKYNKKETKDPAILDQKGCRYIPHVLCVQTNQEVKILNSDLTLHNVHGRPKNNTVFNFGMPKTVKEKTITFRKTDDVFVVKCDVHPWMKSYIQVFNHPYFAVSAKDGKYIIPNIPPGNYEVIAWQEKFGSKKTLIKKVNIGDQTARLDFIFVRPNK